MAKSNVRKIDALGRLSVPKHMRDLLGWGEEDELELIVEGDKLVVRRKQELNIDEMGEDELRKKLRELLG